MIEYLKNILPRISHFSKSLDKVEVFINKPWVYLDEENNNHGYLFHRDKRLIMSLNGNVTEGSWELLPHGKLLIDRITNKILLENMFIDDALMILKKSGSKDESFVLINESVIPDLDALKYLKNKETIQEINDAENNNTIKVLSSGLITGTYFMKGDKVESFDGNIVTGTFRTTNKEWEMYVVVVNGRVSSTYFHIDYATENQKIVIKQRQSNRLNVGDTITKGFMQENNRTKIVVTDIKYHIRYSIKINDDGVITSVFDFSNYDYLKIIIGVIAVFAIAYFIAKLN